LHLQPATKRPREAPGQRETTVKRIIAVAAGCISLMGLLTLTPSPAAAQTQPTLVTLTFRLTLNGVPSNRDSFAVHWGETGLALCKAPCAGNGHSYAQTMTFPKGVTETFVFDRAPGSVTPGHPGQEFGRQTLTANADRTVTAVFTYGTASVPTPATGSAPAVLYGALFAGVGAALIVEFIRRRR